MKLTDVGTIAHGEPTHWYVSIFDEGNSRESAEQLKHQILSDNKLRELIEKRIEELKIKIKAWKRPNSLQDFNDWYMEQKTLQKLLKESKK